jgi:colanic acid/amylovoran biosynthesis glycosyltransferase
MRVAVVVFQFPVLSEVFILQQVTGLLDLGVDVEIFADRPPRGGVVHELYRAYDLASRTYYRRDIPRSSLGRWIRLGRSAMKADVTRLPAVAETLWRSTVLRATPSLVPALKLIDLFRRPPFDVVHAHFGDSGRLCAALPESTVRLITTFHGFDANVTPRLEGPDIYRELFSRGDAFTVNSRFLERRLVSLGCPLDRLTLLPMGVDIDKVTFTPRRLAAGAPVELLTVGRLVPAKGIAYAIRAVAELVARGVAVRYRVVGGGEDLPALNALIRELSVADHVALVGPKPHEEVRALYATAHVFVLPSTRTERGDEEAQGLVVQEAQAAGLPVIVTDIGGVAEGIVPDASGIVCRAADASALAGAIERLIARADEWPAMGLAGRTLVETKFSLPRLNRELLDLYVSVSQSVSQSVARRAPRKRARDTSGA